MSREHEVTLAEVTRSNWVACAKLSVHEDQKENVASNVFTIAESRFHPHYHLRAIYSGELIAGMLAYCHEDDPIDETLFWIFRLVIDRGHQRQGIGREAMRLALEEIRQLGATRVRTMHKPSNQAAAALYESLGFRSIGFHDDGDCLLEMPLS